MKGRRKLILETKCLYFQCREMIRFRISRFKTWVFKNSKNIIFLEIFIENYKQTNMNSMFKQIYLPTPRGQLRIKQEIILE